MSAPLDALLNPVDLSILGVILLSALIGVVRGFFREVLSLAGLVFAGWAGFVYGPVLAPLVPRLVDVQAVHVLMTGLLLAMVVVLLSSAISWLVCKLVSRAGLSGLDRLLGFGFGTVRGALLVAVVVLVAGLTSIPHEPWWQRAVLVSYFETLARGMVAMLPPELAAHFRYR